MREIEKAIKEGKDIQVKVNDKKKLATYSQTTGRA
jgi:hypothetical protein